MANKFIEIMGFLGFMFFMSLMFVLYIFNGLDVVLILLFGGEEAGAV